MPPHDNHPLGAPHTRAEQFTLGLNQLRADDPTCAWAALLHPDDTGESQAAVHLLISCEKVRTTIGADGLSALSIAPAIDEREHPRWPRSSSKDRVTRWAAHFWYVGRWPARFPQVFETYYFRRWVTACHLYKRITPALPTDTGGER